MKRKIFRWPVLAAAVALTGLSAVPALADHGHKRCPKRDHGNHYGWQRGVGNPHRESDDRECRERQEPKDRKGDRDGLQIDIRYKSTIKPKLR